MSIQYFRLWLLSLFKLVLVKGVLSNAISTRHSVRTIIILVRASIKIRSLNCFLLILIWIIFNFFHILSNLLIQHGNMQALVIAILTRVLVTDVNSICWKVWVLKSCHCAIRGFLSNLGILFPRFFFRLCFLAWSKNGRMMTLIPASLPRVLQTNVNVEVRWANCPNHLCLPSLRVSALLTNFRKQWRILPFLGLNFLRLRQKSRWILKVVFSFLAWVLGLEFSKHLVPSCVVFLTCSWWALLTIKWISPFYPTIGVLRWYLLSNLEDIFDRTALVRVDIFIVFIAVSSFQIVKLQTLWSALQWRIWLLLVAINSWRVFILAFLFSVSIFGRPHLAYFITGVNTNS